MTTMVPSDYDKFKELLDKWGVRYSEEFTSSIKGIYIRDEDTGIEAGWEFYNRSGDFCEHVLDFPLHEEQA